jgi:hypothetical protein
MDLLNTIVSTILGPDKSQMSEKDRKQAEQQSQVKRGEASQMAFKASEGQAGDMFMRPETSVGLGASIEDVIKMLFGGGGGGGGGAG